jgi:flagellar biosynthesis protein FlhG
MFISIGGGKGGVGKTFVSANLGIALCTLDPRCNLKVTVVDTDIGGSNLHSFLGITKPRRTLSDFLKNRNLEIKDVIEPTQFPGISAICGADDLLNLVNLSYQQKIKLLRGFNEIEADFIIFDLAAGVELKTLDFFNHAPLVIIVTTPEPTAMQNAYSFIRNALLRKILVKSADDPVLKDLVDNYVEGSLERVKSIRTFLDRVEEADSKYLDKINSVIETFNPRLILNQTERKTDADTAVKFAEVVEKYLFVKLEILGWLPYDPRVRDAVRSGAVFMDTFRRSRTSLRLYSIANLILRMKNQ